MRVGLRGIVQFLPCRGWLAQVEVAKTKCLTFSACSRIRAGAQVPHARHWGALVRLAQAEQ